MNGSDLWSGFSPEQRDRFDKVRATARDAFVPLAEKGHAGRVNRPLLKAMGEHGVLGRLFPSDLGKDLADGRVSAVEICLLREALAGVSTEAETALALQGLGAYPVLLAGGDEVKDRWIPAVARGEAVAAFALSEPDAGSDAAALSLSAERVEGGFRLRGTKKWISNAPDADIYTIFARTAVDEGAKGITAFAVAGDSHGLSGKPLELLSAHPVGQIELEDVFVPDGHVLGEVGLGFGVAMQTLDLFRPSVGAFAVGMAQAALDASVAQAGSRRAFGRNLQDFQAISHKLADMATTIHAARLLVYEAASAYDAGRRVTKIAAMAKLFATEMAQQVIDDAIQIHGASGLERGHLLEHLYRDVRATRIYEGTSEIQREIIARELYR
ncbi:MAG: acyl-CoA dehydrogenase [Actinomycetota bacterium]|jgi:alkylation response protein AidB-like acyl-CoA dehydrogenase|nr:acyl-CoA dehydrogenase [Actinomycetota bacterium]